MQVKMAQCRSGEAQNVGSCSNQRGDGRRRAARAALLHRCCTAAALLLRRCCAEADTLLQFPLPHTQLAM